MSPASPVCWGLVAVVAAACRVPTQALLCLPLKVMTVGASIDCTPVTAACVGACSHAGELVCSLLSAACCRCALPQPSDSDWDKPKPRHPIVGPASYPKSQPDVISAPGLFRKMDPEALFFAFYYQPDTYQQYLAAQVGWVGRWQQGGQGAWAWQQGREHCDWRTHLVGARQCWNFVGGCAESCATCTRLGHCSTPELSPRRLCVSVWMLPLCRS